MKLQILSVFAMFSMIYVGALPPEERQQLVQNVKNLGQETPTTNGTSSKQSLAESGEQETLERAPTPASASEATVDVPADAAVESENIPVESNDTKPVVIDPKDKQIQLVENTPSPPQLTMIFYDPKFAHCYFQPQAKKIAAIPGPFLFISERVSDGQVTMERGYARVDGLLRELKFIKTFEKEDGVMWSYETFGPKATQLDLELELVEKKRKFIRYDGVMIAHRNGVKSEHKISGICGPNASNRHLRN